MSKANKIKSIVKGVAPKETFGTNPSDPWSTKANISEFAGNPAGLLGKYLKSKGINPKFATKDQKIAHSKTGQFLKWQKDHADRASETGTTIHSEQTVEPSPTLKRAKELEKSEKHQTPIVKGVAEEAENLEELSKETLNNYMWAAKHNRDNMDLEASKAIEKNRKEFSPRRHSKITKLLAKSLKRTGNIIKATNKIMAKEAVDKKDTVTFDIPLIIRVLELAREDIKSDMDLHRVVERLIDMRNKGVLTMDDYDTIAAIKEEVYSSVKLEYIKQALNESKEANYGGDYQDSVLALKKKAEQKKVDMKSLADRMQASYRRANQTKGVKPVAEGNGYDDNRTGFAKKPREDDEGYGPTKFKAKSIMDRPHTVHIDGKPWKKFSNGHQAHAAVRTLAAKGKKASAIAHFKEDTYHDPQAATQMPFDGANDPNDVTPPQYKGKRLIQMSKSARIIKSIYKNKGMKEETYDFEKADKSVASYGKPPKMAKTDKKITDGDKEQAAIVLSGGKTLTGDERDTIEIDPKMKMRPNQPEPPKKTGS